MYPTTDNWVISNIMPGNQNAISLGSMRGNGATDNLIAENNITGNAGGGGGRGNQVGSQ